MTGAATPVTAVLFDLDGTLVDSAPDLAGAANDMRIARGLQPYPLAHFRPMVGTGARGMLKRAFGIGPEAPEFEACRTEFLDRYERRMTQDTALFPDIPALLDAIAASGRPWGIVTNKATRFADALVRTLGLLPSAAVLVCGDTTPHSKPHPAPLLEAARRLGVDAAFCAYVGDDHRDIVAGRAAGMRTVAAAWGYLGEGDAIDRWGADAAIESPLDLTGWLDASPLDAPERAASPLSVLKAGAMP